MAIAKISYKSIDQQSNTFNEPLGSANLDVYQGATSRLDNAKKIDALARAMNSLTTNTYRDSTATYEYSINEVIAEEEE